MGTISQDERQEVSHLGYFKDLRERRAWIARMTVLIAVMSLLMMNTYLLFLSTDSVILNLDLVRMEQSNDTDLLHLRLDVLELRIIELQAVAAAANGAARADGPATR
jgi:hypothetical protein